MEAKVALIHLTFDYSKIDMPFPESDKKVMEKVRFILKELGIELTIEEHIYNMHTAQKALKKILYNNKVSVLIVNVINWSGGKIPLLIGKKIDNLPVILWTIGTHRMSLCGYLEVTSAFKLIGKRYKAIIGTQKNVLVLIKRFIHVVQALNKLEKITIGQIGSAPPDFIDAIANQRDFVQRFNFQICPLDVSEIFMEEQKISEKEVKKTLFHFKKAYLIEGSINNKKLFGAIKTALALQNIIQKYKLSAYALRCMPEMQEKESFPCLGISMLADQGVCGACEGDLAAAVTMTILYELSDEIPCVFDIDSINTQRNTLVLWHCGQLGTSLANKKSGNIVITSPQIPANPLGVVLSFPLKEGKVTLAKLNQTADKMLVFNGECFGGNSIVGAYCEVKTNFPLKDLLQSIGEEGIGHHICLVHGDVSPLLEAFCEMSEIEFLYI